MFNEKQTWYNNQVVLKKSTPFDRLYVFDLNDGGEIIASCSVNNLGDRPNTPMDWLCDSDRKELLEYLKSYSSSPFLTSVEKEAVVFFGQLMPPSALGVVWLPDIKVEDIIRIASILGIELCMTSKLSSELERSIRVGKRVVEKYGSTIELMRELWQSLSDTSSGTRPEGDVKAWLTERVKNIARLVGGFAAVVFEETPKDSDDLNYGFISAFTTVSMMLARKLSSTGGVDVIFSKRGSLGITVRLEFSVDVSGEYEVREIEALQRITAEKNIFFDYTITEGAISLCVAPTVKDWSILELKHGDNFFWEE